MKACDMELVMTCESFPEQYDVIYNGERIGYIRYRGGKLTCQPVKDDELLWLDLVCRIDESYGGVIPDDKRGEWLSECKEALSKFWSNPDTELLDALQRQRERMNPMIPDAGEVVISKEVANNIIERLSRIKPDCVIDGSPLLRVLGKNGGGRI